MCNKLQDLLICKAKHYEAESEATNDKFNRGFFEGKAEQARQTEEAIMHMTEGNVQLAIDALNGDT